MVGVERAASTSVLRNHHFLLLWLAQALSQTAQNAVFYALLVLVERRTGSSTHVAIFILSTIIPSVLFGIGAGVVVDRLPKRTVLVITNLLRVPVVLGYILVGDAFFVVYVINFVFSTIAQFFGPAEAAAIPLLVRRGHLLAANGLFNLTFVMSQLAGFVVLGPSLVKLLGPDALLLAVAAAYVAAVILVRLLPPMDASHPWQGVPEGRSLLRGLADELKEGWYLLSRDAGIALSMLQLTTMATLMLVMGMLAPGFASRVLGIPAEDAVYVLSPAGIGLVVGAVLVPRLAPRLGRERSINTGLFIQTLGLLLMAVVRQVDQFLGPRLVGIIPWTPLADTGSLVGGVMLLALVLGLAFALVVIPAQTVLQERAPMHMRGRVFAVQITFGNLASLFPLLFLGALADVIGITSVILLLAAAMLALYAFSVRRTHRLMGAARWGSSSAGAELLPAEMASDPPGGGKAGSRTSSSS